MTSVNKKDGYHPMGAPICLHKKEHLGKLNQNTAQHCVKARCCRHDGNRLDKVLEGWAFGVGT